MIETTATIGVIFLDSHYFIGLWVELEDAFRFNAFSSSFPIAPKNDNVFIIKSDT